MEGDHFVTIVIIKSNDIFTNKIIRKILKFYKLTIGTSLFSFHHTT